MAKKLISYDDEAEGLGLPDVVEGKLSETYALKGEIPTGVVKSVNGAEPDDTGALTIATGKPDAITSPQITRIIASQDPDVPLEDGDLLFVYAPPFSTFEDFSGGTIAGWTPRWVQDSWKVVDDASALDGKALELYGLTGRRALSLNVADGLADVEIVTRAKAGTQTADRLAAGPVVRGAGGAGSETGYFVNTNATTVTLARFANGSYAALGTTPLATTSGQWYWIRLRVVGDQIMVRAWVDGDPEPDEWQITRTDTSVPGPGWCGVATGSNPQAQYWDRLGVAADGGTAPTAVV